MQIYPLPLPPPRASFTSPSSQRQRRQQNARRQHQRLLPAAVDDTTATTSAMDAPITSTRSGVIPHPTAMPPSQLAPAPLPPSIAASAGHANSAALYRTHANAHAMHMHAMATAAASASIDHNSSTTNSSNRFHFTSNSNNMHTFQPPSHAIVDQIKKQQQPSQQRRLSHSSNSSDNQLQPTDDGAELDDDDHDVDDELDQELDDDDLDDLDNNNATHSTTVKTEPPAPLLRRRAPDSTVATAFAAATLAPTNTIGTSSNNIVVKPNGDIIRRRNVGVPKFLRFLYQMLESEDRDVITWSHKGTAFQIRQPDALALTILPKYFKHNKVSSFQRQLNYFGFKKWTKTQTTICTFSHPFFLRADKDKMKLIKRKERVGPGGSSTAALASAESSLGHMSSLQAATSDSEIGSHGQQQARGASSSSSSTTAAAMSQRARPMAPGGNRQSMPIDAKMLAMRRHSTGALALAAAFSQQPTGPATAAASAAPMQTTRKRAGTIDLEMEATRLTDSPSRLDVIKEVGLRLPSRAKRKSLPHVMLPPSLRDRRGNPLVNADLTHVDMTRPFFGVQAAPNAFAPSVFGGGYFGHQVPQSIDVLGQASTAMNLKQNALSSAVAPMSATQLLQLQHSSSQFQQQLAYQRQHSHPGTMSCYAQQQPHIKSDSAIDMSALAVPLQSQQQQQLAQSWGPASTQSFHNNSNNPLQQQQQQQSATTPFDTMPIMDYTTNSAQLTSHALKLHSQQQQSQQSHSSNSNQSPYLTPQPLQKDYFDVLLESGALDDPLAPSATSTTATTATPQQASGSNWEQSFGQQQQQQQHTHQMQQQHQQQLHHAHQLQQMRHHHQQQQQLPYGYMTHQQQHQQLAHHQQQQQHMRQQQQMQHLAVMHNSSSSNTSNAMGSSSAGSGSNNLSSQRF